MNDSLCLWFSNFSINLLTLFSRVVFCCSTAERGTLRNFSNRSMVPKMILRLGFVDLVDHIASSISVRHVVLSELSEPSGRAHPEFSYIPQSPCKLQVVCSRERLHVTVFGKKLQGFSEEHHLSFSLEPFASWNELISYYRIQFIRVPDVVDVLGKFFRQQYIVLQCSINSIIA